MSDPMDGYVFNSEEERRQAQKWLEKHTHEIWLLMRTKFPLRFA